MNWSLKELSQYGYVKSSHYGEFIVLSLKPFHPASFDNILCNYGLSTIKDTKLIINSFCIIPVHPYP
jgi:hypothetical protein